MVRRRKTADGSARSTQRRATASKLDNPGASPSSSRNPTCSQRANYYGFDFGTSKVCVTCAPYQEGQRLGVHQVELCRFRQEASTVEDHIPAIAAFIDNDFYFGTEVLELRKRNAIASNKVIREFKLCLYDHPEGSEASQQVQRVYSQLHDAGKMLQDLLAASLRKIWQEVRADTSNLPASFGEATCKERVYFTVPRLTTQDIRPTMTQAAKQAGLPNEVCIVYEPLAAAACIMEELLNRHPNGFAAAGANILILDMGAGTVDAGVLRMPNEPLEPGQYYSRFRLVTQPEVDQSFRAWLRQTRTFSSNDKPITGGIQHAAQLLHWPEDHLVDFFVDEFRDLKRRFGVSSHMSITAKSEKNNRAITISPDEATLRSFFQPHIDKIVELAKRQIAQLDVNGIKLFVLPSGGFSQNRFVTNELTKAFARINRNIEMKRLPTGKCDNAVAFGALAVPHTVNLKDLQSRYSIGIVNSDERYNEAHHSDGIHKHSHYDSDNVWQEAGTVNRKVVFTPSWYGGDSVVNDRILWLVWKGSNPTSEDGLYFKEAANQEFSVPWHTRELKYTIVFTERDPDDLHDHEALCDEDGNVHHGFSLFSGTVRMPKKLLDKHKKRGRVTYDADIGEGEKEDRVQVYGQFLLQYDGTTVKAGVKILEPEKRYFDENGELKKNFLAKAKNVTWEAVWEAGYDHNVIDTIEGPIRPEDEAIRGAAPGKLRSPRKRPAEAGSSSSNKRPRKGHNGSQVHVDDHRFAMPSLTPDLATWAQCSSGTGKGKGKARVLAEQDISRSSMESLGPSDMNQRYNNNTVSYDFPSRY